MLGVLLILVLLSTLFNGRWYTKKGLWPSEWCGLLESIATVVNNSMTVVEESKPKSKRKIRQSGWDGLHS